MTNLKFQSVFDIIGPVMIGPSSSHTAGAVRIGKIVSSIFGDEPTEVEFQLYNSFAKTYRGHGTDVALVAGILGMDTDDPRIPDSLDIARERGIKVYWRVNKDSNTPHPNTTRIIIKTIKNPSQPQAFPSVGKHSSNRAQRLLCQSKYEYANYYYCSPRCPWYDCESDRCSF